jgi:hypothetical protein
MSPRIVLGALSRHPRWSREADGFPRIRSRDLPKSRRNRLKSLDLRAALNWQRVPS